MRIRQQHTAMPLAQLPDWVLCATGKTPSKDWQPGPMPDGYEQNQGWWDREERLRVHGDAVGAWLSEHAPGISHHDLHHERRRRVREEWHDYQ